jgi:hypothetical protein
MNREKIEERLSQIRYLKTKNEGQCLEFLEEIERDYELMYLMITR